MKLLRISAIAVLAVRSAVRSRFVLSLVGSLALVVAGLPFVLKGDGTLEGQVRVLLQYTLGSASLILIAATLWISCSAISREVEDRSIRLIAVKPVPRHEIWLGKWLGLLLLNGFLLLCCGLTLYGLVQWTLLSSAATAEARVLVRETMLTGRRQVLPREEPLGAEVSLRYQRVLDEGRLSEDHTREEVLQNIRKAVLGERLTARTGEACEWRFDLPRSGKTDRAVTLRFRLSTLAWNRLSITGDWVILSLSGEELCRVTAADCLGGAYHLRVPASFWARARASAGAGRGTVPVSVQFRNGTHDVSHTAFFDSTGPVELLVRETGFFSNLVRALIIVLCQTAAVAALGLMMGSIFSPPVAVFSACALLTMVAVAQYFVMASSPELAIEEHHHHGEAAPPGHIATGGKLLAEGLNAIAAPARQFKPIRCLADGILVSWNRTALAIGVLVFAYPVVCMCLSGYVLNRRELAGVRSP